MMHDPLPANVHKPRPGKKLMLVAECCDAKLKLLSKLDEIDSSFGADARWRRNARMDIERSFITLERAILGRGFVSDPTGTQINEQSEQKK